VTLYVAANAVMPTTRGAAYPAHRHSNQDDAAGGHSVDRQLKVVAFGIEFASALTAAATVELVDTGTVAATGLTAHVAAGVQPYGADSQSGASDMTLGTGATGYWTTWRPDRRHDHVSPAREIQESADRGDLLRVGMVPRPRVRRACVALPPDPGGPRRSPSVCTAGIFGTSSRSRAVVCGRVLTRER